MFVTVFCAFACGLIMSVVVFVHYHCATEDGEPVVLCAACAPYAEPEFILTGHHAFKRLKFSLEDLYGDHSAYICARCLGWPFVRSFVPPPLAVDVFVVVCCCFNVYLSLAD